jgi:hypothetical protein
LSLYSGLRVREIASVTIGDVATQNGNGLERRVFRITIEITRHAERSRLSSRHFGELNLARP